MEYRASYLSPLGPVTLAADGGGLTGLWFVGQRYYGVGGAEEFQMGETPLLREAGAWLDVYFSGRDPGPPPPLRPWGTPFQREVWALLCAIPYGTTCTYGALAQALAARRGGAGPSARAVGGAVGKNHLSILIPCHRVVGARGALTGYAGGVEKKRALLELEGWAPGPSRQEPFPDR